MHYLVAVITNSKPCSDDIERVLSPYSEVEMPEYVVRTKDEVIGASRSIARAFLKVIDEYPDYGDRDVLDMSADAWQELYKCEA